MEGGELSIIRLIIQATVVVQIVIGILLGCLGVLIPLVGVVLGAVALSQIKRTHQQGRGLAIAGIAIGSVTLTLLLFSIAVLAAHHPTFIGG